MNILDQVRATINRFYASVGREPTEIWLGPGEWRDLQTQASPCLIEMRDDEKSRYGKKGWKSFVFGLPIYLMTAPGVRVGETVSL